MFQLLNPSSKTANHTDIHCGVSGFEIKEGMARVTALVVDTPDMTVTGEGQVNLRDSAIEICCAPCSWRQTTERLARLGVPPE